VREFGTRSGNFIYAAAIVAAFLGAITIDGGSVGAWNWMHSAHLPASFVLHTLSSGRGGRGAFVSSHTTWSRSFVDRRSVSIDDMRRELIDRIQAASGLFLVDTLAWLVALF
jgi:hypothetical protein